MASTVRDPITCHVLDTTTGRPGPNIAVKLFCTTNPDIIFTSKTNDDGRIANWENTQSESRDIESFITSHGGVTSTLKFMIQEHAAAETTPSCEDSTLPQHYSRKRN
jgi:5-hydroxyisourate hydrolase